MYFYELNSFEKTSVLHRLRQINKEKENMNKTDETFDFWNNLQIKAKENMLRHEKNGNGVLIEVAAQHPLIDGLFPNEEFEKRLQTAIELYQENKTKGILTKIYVPGSLHMDKGVADKRSLSSAGGWYLEEHGIAKEDIYGEDMNFKYKGEDGVYNSADECFVAGKIFEDGNFRYLYSACSSAQLMRKALCYIRFGYIPFFKSVSCTNMHHSYVYEVFKSIPSVLNDKNAWQDDSEIAKKMRQERNPSLHFSQNSR